MSDLGERPLVTFALFSYNQEKYIRQAVESVLAQDYSPLEIILSDDCSPDKTFENMSEVVKNYHGPHKIIVRKNNENLGLSEHINVINNMSNGGFLIVSAGDDISDSIRATVLVDKWIRNGKKPISIFSGMREIDLNSKETGKIYRSKLVWPKLNLRDFLSKNIGVFGASHAWSMDVVNKFPNMHSDVINEDHVIPFRAALLSGVLYVDEVLVSYRANMGLASQYAMGNFPGSRVRRSPGIVKRPYIVYVQKVADIKWMCNGQTSLLKLAQSRRADYLFRYWLAINGRFTSRRVFYFARRCRMAWIFREMFFLLRRD